MPSNASETSPLLNAIRRNSAADIVGSDLEADGLERRPTNDVAQAAQFSGDKDQHKRLKRYIWPAVSVGIFLSAADQTIIASSYGKIGSELEALNLTSWIATSYFLTLTSFQPLYGKLSDIFGRKPCLLFAYGVFGLGSLFCGLSQDIYQLIAARIFQGIGGGGMTTVVSILLSDIVPLKDRGLWQGYMNIIYAAGAGTGAPLGGAFTDGPGWRWSFLFQPPLCVIALVAVSLALKEPAAEGLDWRKKLARIDFLGAFTLVAAVLGLILGLDRGSNVSWVIPITYGPLIASGLFFALFFVVETRVAKEPFTPRRIVLDRTLFAGYLVNFFASGSVLAVYYYIPLFYQAVDGLSATSASLRLLPAVFSSVSGSLFGGYVIRRSGRYYWLTVAAYLLLSLGCFLVFASTGSLLKNDWVTAAGLVVGSFGNGIGVTSSLIAIIANAGPKDQALATACSYLFRQLGTVIGISSSATIIQQQLRRSLRQGLGSGEEAIKIEKGVRQSLELLKSLPQQVAVIVRNAYGDAVRHGFGLMFGIAAGAAIASFFIREKKLDR